MTIFRLSVCPHDTARNITGWFLLNTYLQRNLKCDIRFEPKENFIEERNSVLSGGFHIVYANPFSAAIFRNKLGFIPIAKPIGVFDETVLVSNLNNGIPNQQPVKIASATDKLIVHTLGVSLLKARNISVSDCEFQFVGTHLKAAQAVIEGKADLGFVYSETWSGLTDSTRQALAIVSQTESKQAFHSFCIAPEWGDKLERVQGILCNMQNNYKSKRILDDLHFSAGFEPLGSNDLDQLIVQLENRAILGSTAAQ